jgi:hypothetical protein
MNRCQEKLDGRPGNGRRPGSQAHDRFAKE